MNSWLKKEANDLFMTLCRPFNSREVTVAASTPEQERDYYKYEQIGPSGMALYTENFLRGNLLRQFFEKSPREVIETVNQFYQVSGDPVYLLIAADICRYLASKAPEDEKLRFHLAAFWNSYRSVSVKKKMKESDRRAGCQLLQELQIFNESIAGIFSCLKKMNLLDSSAFSMREISGKEFVFEAPHYQLSVPRKAVSDFSLCSSCAVKALRLLNRHSGLGVPLTAKINSKELSRTLRTPPGLTIPVTLFFHVRTAPDGKIILTPHYQDTSVDEFLHPDASGEIQKHWPLARDFTTPLACFMSTITERNLLAGMLNPVKYEEYTGLYMMEPYSPKKIPVIFVHGLMSSPETWGQMINSLKYDSSIRKKYQFWFFSYSTGVPVIFSARKLRDELLKAQKEFCTTPEATENFEKMVVVGHSMGGMATRLLMQENPFHLLEKLTGKTAEEIKKLVSPEDWRFICSIVLPPLPFIRRVVFMAVPHRGASAATRQIAKLGIRLIRLPEMILKNKDRIARLWKVFMPGEKISWRKESFLTGIDNLNPDSVFVRGTCDSPLKKDVVYHSIIGNTKKAGCPGGSDGVVPYGSSHLDGIASEYIVQSDHGVHRHPEAIRELLRILLLHLRENAD